MVRYPKKAKLHAQNFYDSFGLLLGDFFLFNLNKENKILLYNHDKRLNSVVPKVIRISTA